MWLGRKSNSGIMLYLEIIAGVHNAEGTSFRVSLPYLAAAKIANPLSLIELTRVPYLYINEATY